jgi:hypothetical protein
MIQPRAIVCTGLILLLCCNLYGQSYIVQVKSLKNKKWGYIDNTGQVIAEPQYERCYEFSSAGLAPVFDSKDRQYYFITKKGARIVTDIKDFKLYDRMGFGLETFSDGLIPVEHNDKWGYLNKDGQLAIPAKYDEATGFGSGHAVVTLNKKIYIINTRGEETPVGPGISEVKKFSEDLAPFRADDKKYGYIDTKGDVVIKAQFETVGYFRGGVAWARTTKGIIGFIDTKGDWIIEPQFIAAGTFDDATGLARVKTETGWAYVDKAGNLMKMDDTQVWEHFSEGLALGKKNGLFGYFNAQGEWAIQPQFDGGRDFKNGFAGAKKGGKWGIIDKQGNWVINPEYDGIKDMELVN